MRKLSIFAASAAAVVGALLVVPAADAASGYTVANATSPASCARNANFSSIQAAVDAAPPGATISVCPGTYQEYVTVPAGKNNLSIRGLGGEPTTGNSGAPVILFPTTSNTDSTAYDPNALVTVNGATGVDIEGITVSGPFTDNGCESGTTVHYGVLIVGGGSAALKHDYITQIENSVTALEGCQDGIAVRAGSMGLGQVGTLTLQNSLLDRYQKGGVVVDGPGSSGQIESTTITGIGPTGQIAQNGVQISRQAVGSVQNSDISANEYTGAGYASEGVLLYGDGGGTTVQNNKLTNNDIAVDAESASGDSVQNNQISTSSSNVYAAGILVYSESSSTFMNNKTSGGTEGIESFQVTGTTFKNNQVDGVSDVGIYNDPGSTGNLYQNNHATGSGTYDCEDDSTGTGTAGTANTWTNDHGATSLPAGICRP
jgi:hypothetical protein